MIRKSLRSHRFQKGITGLETAIILIAFVVVAAVFAYTVLSAGLFATQKSSEAVYNGLQQSSSTLTTRGSVVAYMANESLGVGKVEFTVSTSATQGTDQVDLTAPYTLTNGDTLTEVNLKTPTQISFTDANVSVPACAWTLSWIGKHSNANILNPGEQAVITVWLKDYSGGIYNDTGTTTQGFIGSTDDVGTYHNFTMEVKTTTGAVLTLQRTTPALLEDVMDLH